MSTSPDTQTAALPAVSAEQVLTYLRGHPNFLAEHPQLISVLTPPTLKTGRDVLDMQQFMIDRLRGEIESLRSGQRELMDASRINMLSQERVHGAVLALLGARSFEHLLEVVTVDFVTLLDIDVVTLCFETPEIPIKGLKARGVHTLKPGAVARLVGTGRNILLREETLGDPILFGEAAQKVHSDALIGLKITKAAPPGLLALGSSTAKRFHSDQGTDLLTFLADALGRSMRTWLDLPS